MDLTDSPPSSPSQGSAPNLGQLTTTSVHRFDSYKELHAFVKGSIADLGFRIVWKNKGGGEGGKARCWCYSPAPVKVEAGPRAELSSIDISASQLGSLRQRAIVQENDERRDTGCEWVVYWNRRKTGGKFYITKRALVHNHSVRPRSGAGLVIDSLLGVPVDLDNLVLALVRSGIRGENDLHSFVQSQLTLTIDKLTFHNLLNRAKRSLGKADVDQSEGEFTILLQWLVDQEKGVAKVQANSDKVLTGVFYMSTDMLYNMERNGCVLIMDTTHKTNRFLWPLLLICGINEHAQTILLAVAIIQHQEEADFVWVFEQLKAVISEAARANIKCIMTDGDAAMAKAIDSELQNAKHLRCWFHIEQNLRFNLSGLLGADTFNEFLPAWKGVAGQDTTEQYMAEREKLHANYKDAVPYLTKNIWKNDSMFIHSQTRQHCTLGILSTQRVEGMNSKLKGMLHVNSRMRLIDLFKTFEYAASEIDRAAVKELEKQDKERVKPAYADTFIWRVHPHVTNAAYILLQEQFDRVTNYRAWGDGQAQRYLVQRIGDDGALVGLCRSVVTSTCSCSCCYPLMYLLPCRHVMALNIFLRNSPFQVGQCGVRWLRSYQPPASYAHRGSPASSPEAAAPSSSPAVGNAPSPATATASTSVQPAFESTQVKPWQDAQTSGTAGDSQSCCP